ncbi:hypothetical protein HN51_010645, partial [Arachis hypogaea]
VRHTMAARRKKAVKLKQKSGTLQCPKGDQLEHHQINLDKDVFPSASSPSFAIHSKRSTTEYVDLLPFIFGCSFLSWL